MISRSTFSRFREEKNPTTNSPLLAFQIFIHPSEFGSTISHVRFTVQSALASSLLHL